MLRNVSSPCRLVHSRVEEDQSGGRRAAVVIVNLVRDEREGSRGADSREPVRTPQEVVAVPGGQLTDIKDLPRPRIGFGEKLILLDLLGAQEYRVTFAGLERAFGSEGMPSFQSPAPISGKPCEPEVRPRSMARTQ